MSLIILEGLDKTGKSTYAEHLASKGWEVVHFSAPDKKYSQEGYTGPSYLDDIIELIQQASLKDICLDRSAWGELVWPQVYGRKAALSEDDFEILKEIEDSVGCERILFHDPDTEGHWQRCVDYKEPLTRVQFLKARNLFEKMAKVNGFKKMTVNDIPGFQLKDKSKEESKNVQQAQVDARPVRPTPQSKEQHKLAKANAIHDVLSRPIIKSKGQAYSEVEDEIRTFLSSKLSTILGGETPETFTKEEAFALKMLAKKLTTKE